MSAEKSVHGIAGTWLPPGGGPLLRMAPARELPIGRGDHRLPGAGRRAKDLIGLLISHGARIRRSARPRSRIVLTVFNPSGEPAADISFD